MINNPSWLPDIIPFSDFNSDWIKYLDHIYQIFKKDFIDSKPFYKNKLVLFDDRPINNYPACFWHLVTEKKIKDSDRMNAGNFCLLRCERICWIRPIIENYDDQIVSVWESKRQKKINTVLFIENCDYAVVLTNVKNRFYLVTAYYINYPLRKEQLMKEREEYLKMQKSSQNGTI